MKTLKVSLRQNTERTVHVKYVTALMLATLSLSLTSCVTLKKDVEIGVTLPKIIKEGDIEYWCLEKTDLTSLVQEADRCR